MRLNRWNHWLFVFGFMLMQVTDSSAQSDLKSVSELDRLPNWIPVSRTVLSGFHVNSLTHSIEYTSFDYLLKKVKEGSKVEALTIDSNILKQGGLSDLSLLQNVRVLNINLSDAMPRQTDSLFQIIQHWPVLERLSFTISASISPKIDSANRVALPATIQHCPKLHDIRLSGTGFHWNESLRALIGLKTLRYLAVNSWQLNNPQPVHTQPIHFVALPQLTGLRISGVGFVIKPGMLANLGQLRELTLRELQIDTTTFDGVFAGLSQLESLTIDNIQPLRKLTLGRLTNLKSLEMTSNPDLSVAASTLAGLSNLERLVIQNSRSVDLSAICPLTRLKVLFINGNSRTNKPGLLPECISQLGQLTELRLEYILLSRLPTQIGSLHQLQKLSMINCGLDSLPTSLGQLTALQELVLTGNKLRRLPSVGRMGSLLQLNVSSNQLTELQDDIGQLSQLKSLDVNQNKLTSLPASLTRLVNLRTLSVAFNQLEQLPEQLGKLRKLQTLWIAGNQLISLPNSIGQLDSLQRLTIGKNRLRTLPNSLTRLHNLKDLMIGANELTALPVDIGALKQLTELRLEQLPLTELPASICELQNLRSLQIYFTRLRLLPDNIGALTKLWSVFMPGNELIALPNSIGGWKEVTILSLDGNKLEGLPNSIGRMRKLRTLRIGGKYDTVGVEGGIRQLPDSIVHCSELWDLEIERQPQLDADDVFTKAAQMKGLTYLKITNCSIKKIPDLNWKTVPWETLELSHNGLTELPLGLLDAPVLENINARDNRLPDPLNHDFSGKEALRVAFVETGVLPLTSLSRPNRKVAEAYQQMAIPKAYFHDWAGAMSALEKAIDFAPDTIRAYPYAQRADLHFSRKAYTEALVDYDQAIQYAPRLRKGKLSDSLTANHMLVTYWQQKATVLGAMGQYDAALSAITQAESFIPASDNGQLSSLIHTERGRYLTLKNKLVDADSSYRKAIRAYEKLTYPDPKIPLSIVELSLLTGQYDRAQRALANVPIDQMAQFYPLGYATLKEYLAACLTILKNEQTGTQATERLTAYLDKHPIKIYKWNFDLVENWLSKSKLPNEKVMALRQLTDATKARLNKLE